MKWRIYYFDNTVNDGPIETAPTLGVAAIVERNKSGRVIHQRCSYYVYMTDGIHPCNQFDGLIDLVLHDCSNIIRVFQGRSMTNDVFWKLYDRIKTENP